LTVLATAIGLLLALAVVTAQAPPDFDSSYKTGPQYADLGDLIHYTIVAVNTGGPVQNVVLSDSLPSGVQFIPGSCTYTYDGQSWNCGDDLHQMWQANFASGDRITTTLAVWVTASTAQWPLVNHAYLSWNGDEKEMVFTTTVGTPPPDFSLSYKTGPHYAKMGDVITYTIVAVNTGGPVQSVALSDTLPSLVDFVPGSCRYTYDGQSWTCGDLGQIWQRNFATGGRITTTFAVAVTVSTVTWPLENCAYLSWDGSQEEMCFTTRVADYIPDFTSSYKTGPLFAEIDDEIWYTIVAVNTGEAVQDVVLSDTLPSGLHFVANSCTYIYAGQSRSCDPSAPDQMWREDLASGARITTTFAVTVAAGTGTARLPVENCAYLSWGGVQHPQCFTTTLNPLYIYLPLVLRNS
jgi:uncharacterized repeat protein (TIGR01451 family)